MNVDDSFGKLEDMLREDGYTDANVVIQALYELKDAVHALVHPTEWINEDELPKGYPYHEMYPLSKLGADGLGGVRIFPKIN